MSAAADVSAPVIPLADFSASLVLAGVRPGLLALLIERGSDRLNARPLLSSASNSYVGSRWMSTPAASTAIRVANVGSKPGNYVVTLFDREGRVVYESKGPALSPGEERLFSIADKRDRNTRDAKGRTVPMTSEDGTFEISSADAGAVLFAASATPAGPSLREDWCCGQMNPIIVPDPWNGYVNYSSFAHVMVQNTCTNRYEPPGFEYYWNLADDIYILDISFAGKFTGLAPGSTFANADVQTYPGGPGWLGCGEPTYEPAASAANVQCQIGWWFNPILPQR